MPSTSIPLSDVVHALINEPQLPALDRWFSTWAKTKGLSLEQQGRIWNELRQWFTSIFETVPESGTALNPWAEVRIFFQRKGNRRREAPPVSTLESRLRAAGIPAWLESEWGRRVGRSGWSDSHQERFLSAQATAAPLYVWFRGDPMGQQAQARWLAERRVQWSPQAQAFFLTTREGMEAAPEAQGGLVQLQDAASQSLVKSLDLKPGLKVWDVCAGRGGKTLQAASAMRGRGVVFATDVSPVRLKVLNQRIRRSGWQNVRIVPWDGLGSPNFGVEGASSGLFDRIFIDAPCSASGTWRRDPEARLRLTPARLQELIAIQSNLLDVAWTTLKPGGLLAYMTCSWLVAENEAVVEAFVSRVSGQIVSSTLPGLPYFDANTMYVALLQKNSS